MLKPAKEIPLQFDSEDFTNHGTDRLSGWMMDITRPWDAYATGKKLLSQISPPCFLKISYGGRCQAVYRKSHISFFAALTFGEKKNLLQCEFYPFWDFFLEIFESYFSLHGWRHWEFDKKKFNYLKISSTSWDWAVPRSAQAGFKLILLLISPTNWVGVGLSWAELSSVLSLGVGG